MILVFERSMYFVMDDFGNYEIIDIILRYETS
jgi:hypothetical protein